MVRKYIRRVEAFRNKLPLQQGCDALSGPQENTP